MARECDKAEEFYCEVGHPFQMVHPPLAHGGIMGPTVEASGIFTLGHGEGSQLLCIVPETNGSTCLAANRLNIPRMTSNESLKKPENSHGTLAKPLVKQ